MRMGSDCLRRTHLAETGIEGGETGRSSPVRRLTRSALSGRRTALPGLQGARKTSVFLVTAAGAASRGESCKENRCENLHKIAGCAAAQSDERHGGMLIGYARVPGPPRSGVSSTVSSTPAAPASSPTECAPWGWRCDAQRPVSRPRFQSQQCESVAHNLSPVAFIPSRIRISFSDNVSQKRR